MENTNIEDKEINPENVENLKEELSKQKEYYLRIIAEYENKIKRIQNDALHSISLTLENVSNDFSLVINDLNKASEVIENQEHKKGIVLIEKNLVNILKKYGIEEINPEFDTEFDPNQHHAISTEQNNEIEEGKIIKCVQKGYKSKLKIINPALVIISKL